MRNYSMISSAMALCLAAPATLATTQSVAAPIQATGDASAAGPATSSVTAADAKAQARAAQTAAKAEAKRLRDLKAKYGEGPYPDEISAYVDAKSEKLRPLYKALYTGGERNAVLNFERLGLAAYQLGSMKEAAWAFDQALNRIEAIYADNPQAATARSVFHNEANKDFKGEPYERAMAYYYRGLIYLHEGNFQDAAVSFKNAEHQDTLSDTESFQSDFAVMNYLLGWSQQCSGQGAAAKDSFEFAAKAQEGLKAPKPDDNVLLVAELGNGPVKVRDGAQAQKLLFQGGAEYPETATSITLVDGDQKSSVPLIAASSLKYQATTRGGRAIDGLMDGKATWKDSTDTLGTVLSMQGAMDTTGAGGYMQIAGSLFSAFSSAMKTNADIRAWDALPDMIMVGTAKAKSAKWQPTATYLKGTEKLDLAGETLRAVPGKCSIVWTRSRPAAYGEAIAGEDDGVAAAQNRKKPVQLKNKAFRVALQGSAL